MSQPDTSTPLLKEQEKSLKVEDDRDVTLPYKDIYGALYIALNKQAHRWVISIFAAICVLLQLVTIFGLAFSVLQKQQDEAVSKAMCELKLQESFYGYDLVTSNCYYKEILAIFSDYFMYIILIAVSLLYIARLCEVNQQIEVMQCHKEEQNQNRKCILSVPIILQGFMQCAMAFFGLVIILMFNSIGQMLEGWVVLYVIQEIPKNMYKVVVYLSEDVVEIIQFELEFESRPKSSFNKRLRGLIICAVIAISIPILLRYLNRNYLF